MTATVFPRFVLISKDEEEPVDVCDNCKREWKRGMLCEVKDYFQRVEPGGVVPSGECPECGAFCYPKWLTEKRLKEWFQESMWTYPGGDERFLEVLTRKLTDHFGESCRIWQSESHIKSGKYPQYLCSADLRGIGGDVAHLWRDGQTWWPMVGDYSIDDMEKCEIILRDSLLESQGRK